MGALIPLYRKIFINTLGEVNRKEMKRIEIGNTLSVGSINGSVLNGRLESFEENGILLIINKKSKVIIKGENIEEIKKMEL